MNTAEVDLDRLVDYEREYRSVVKRAQVTGDHMIGLCPFHDDSKNSFSVDLKTGRWHCFSEDIGGNYVDFVAKIFQSTLPRRERLERDDPAAAFFYFNPRSREGSDSNIIQQISFSLYNTVYFVSNNIK